VPTAWTVNQASSTRSIDWSEAVRAAGVASADVIVRSARGGTEVTLDGYGDDRIKVIKIVRGILGLGIREARDKATPFSLGHHSAAAADSVVAELAAAGATAHTTAPTAPDNQRQVEGTTVDVVRDLLGCLPSPERPVRLSMPQLRDLADRLAAHHDAFRVPAPAPGEFRTMFSGMPLDGGVPLLLTELMYAHTTVVYDPFEAAMGLHPPTASDIAEAFTALHILAPLVDAGLVHLLPYRRMAARRKEDILDLANGLAMEGGFANAARPAYYDALDHHDRAWMKEFLEFDRTPQRANEWAHILAACAEVDGRYMPATHDRRKLWWWSLHTTERALTGPNLELVVLPSLYVAELDWATPHSPADLLSLRRGDDGFIAWRQALRNSVRLIRETPISATFKADARAVFADTLEPTVDRLQRKPLGARLRSSGGSTAAHLVFSSAAFTSGAAALGTPVAGLVAAGASSATLWLGRALIGDRPTGEATVLAELGRRRS
jgi:ribosomal protein L7/L12